MIAILILAVVSVIAILASAFDVAHDGHGRVRTDWTRVPPSRD